MVIKVYVWHVKAYTQSVMAYTHLSWRTPICHGGPVLIELCEHQWPDPPPRTSVTFHGGFVQSLLLFIYSFMLGVPGQARNDNTVFRRLRTKTNQHIVRFSCWIFHFFCSNIPQSGIFWVCTKIYGFFQIQPLQGSIKWVAFSRHCMPCYWYSTTSWFFTYKQTLKV
jgi:hypothetical protein